MRKASSEVAHQGTGPWILVGGWKTLFFMLLAYGDAREGGGLTTTQPGWCALAFRVHCA